MVARAPAGDPQQAARDKLEQSDGIVLGGTFGVGTVAFALGIGPCIEASLALLERSPLAVAVATRPSPEPPAIAAELHPR